jgi:hypothetical protein
VPTFPDDPNFELIPANDEDLLSADDQLAAAEASLSDDPFATAATQPPPIPFGRSWAWDRQRERYERLGTAPVEVRGLDALRQWVYNALSTAQGVHPIFSDEFGIEDPDDWIGLVDPVDAIATFEPRAREAVQQHDRIEDLDEMTPEWDPSTGTITIPDLLLITDQANAVPLGDIELKPNF